MKMKSMKLPLFKVGEVIDISYKNGGLPNRIYVKAIYTRECDSEWMYQVLLENTGNIVSMAERFIKDRSINKNAFVYKIPTVMDRYKEGWRFCGNNTLKETVDTGKMISGNVNIRDIIVFPALSAQGHVVKDSYGLWIRYMNTIANNGEYIVSKYDGVVKRIK